RSGFHMMHLLGPRASRRPGLCVKEDFRARSLPSTLLNDSAPGLPARLLLAPHELAVALAQVEAAEEVGLDLENLRAALLHVVAVHIAARARRAVKLGEEDQGGKHTHLRFVGGLDLGAEPSRGWSRTPLSLTLRRMLTTTRLRSAAIPVMQSLNASECVPRCAGQPHGPVAPVA